MISLLWKHSSQITASCRWIPPAWFLNTGNSSLCLGWWALQGTWRNTESQGSLPYHLELQLRNGSELFSDQVYPSVHQENRNSPVFFLKRIFNRTGWLFVYRKTERAQSKTWRQQWYHQLHTTDAAPRAELLTPVLVTGKEGPPVRLWTLKLPPTGKREAMALPESRSPQTHIPLRRAPHLCFSEEEACM